jgi:hypothetical protein
MSTKYPGGMITKTLQTPTSNYATSPAPGIWTLDQAMQYNKAGVWPTAGNPANFLAATNSTILYAYIGNSSVAVDSSNNIYVSGYNRQNAASGNLSNTPMYQKYSGNNVVWQRAIVVGTDNGNDGGVVVTSSGNLYVAGGYAQMYPPASYYGAYIEQLSTTDGTTIAKYGYTDGGVTNYGITQLSYLGTDSSGNLYGAGKDGNSYGVTVMKFNSSGSILWQKLITNGTSPRYTLGQLTVDSSGNVYVAGGINVLGSPFPVYPFVVKYDTNGTKQWMKAWTNAANNGFGDARVAVSSGGTPYVVTARGGGTGFYFFTLNASTGAIVSQQNFNNTSGNSPGPLSVDQSTGDVYMASQAFNATYAGFIKLNSSLALQYARQLYSVANPTSGSINRIIPAFTNRIVVCGTIPDGDNMGALYTFPNDGSLTGSYSANIGSTSVTWTYATAALTTFTEALVNYTGSGSNVGTDTGTMYADVGGLTNTVAANSMVSGSVLA